MSNEIINQHEGQQIETLVWPFYRYTALIPEQIGGDLFEWLYLSLVVYYNQNNNLPQDSYSENAKQSVSNILSDKFSTVIDGQTLEKIIYNAENDFVVQVIQQNKKKEDRLKEETFSFLDTYENLFSDKLDVKFIYQDGITGEVLPFFGDIHDLPDCGKQLTVRQNVKEPSKKAVKRAYEQYIKIKKYNEYGDTSDIEITEEEDFVDEDDQTFFDDDIEEVSFERKKNEEKSLRNYNVIYLKDKKVLFNLEVPLYIEDNTIAAKSPFGILTDQWMDKCLKKGRNISDELDMLIKECEEKYIIEEKVVIAYFEDNKNDFASTLNACQTLYRLIHPLNDNRLKQYVVGMDAYFATRNELFYSFCGKFLERLLKKVNYRKTESDLCQATTYEMYCRELDRKLQHKNVAYESLKYKNIFYDWCANYSHSNERSKFKATLADILLRSNLADSPLMYRSFINDMFGLYSKRNTVDHDDDNGGSVDVDEADIDKLIKITKVLLEII